MSEKGGVGRKEKARQKRNSVVRERRRQTKEEGGKRERARERGVLLTTEAIYMARRPQEREKDHGR